MPGCSCGTGQTFRQTSIIFSRRFCLHDFFGLKGDGQLSSISLINIEFFLFCSVFNLFIFPVVAMRFICQQIYYIVILGG